MATRRGWIAAIWVGALAGCGGAAERPQPRSEPIESHRVDTTVHEESRGSAVGNAEASEGG